MTNLGPYRTPGITLDTVLGRSEQVDLIKNVISKGEVGIKGLLEILYDSGYDSDDSEIFLRYKKTTPVFPDKFRPLEDRFVAVVKKIDSGHLLVSGSYNNDIADLNRNLDAIRDIDSAYAGRISKIVKTADNKFFKYAYEGIVGTVLSASLIAGSALIEGGVILGSLFGIATGAYYVKNRFKPISKETINAANYLSVNAKDYIFNDIALIKIETEASQIRKDRKRHEVFVALGGLVSPEIFFKELDSLNEYWAKKKEWDKIPEHKQDCFCGTCRSRAYDRMFLGTLDRYCVMRAFEKTHELSKENYFSDLMKAINTLFGPVSGAE